MFEVSKINEMWQTKQVFAIQKEIVLETNAIRKSHLKHFVSVSAILSVLNLNFKDRQNDSEAVAWAALKLSFHFQAMLNWSLKIIEQQ